MGGWFTYMLGGLLCRFYLGRGFRLLFVAAIATTNISYSSQLGMSRAGCGEQL